MLPLVWCVCCVLAAARHIAGNENMRRSGTSEKNGPAASSRSDSLLANCCAVDENHGHLALDGSKRVLSANTWRSVLVGFFSFSFLPLHFLLLLEILALSASQQTSHTPSNPLAKRRSGPFGRRPNLMIPTSIKKVSFRR